MGGYLPTRGSFMLDTVVIAMFAVVALLALSIVAVKRGHYQTHRSLQLGMATVLAIAVTLFEIDIRFVTKDWQKLAQPSPYYASGWVHGWLAIHLCFAIPAPFWWAYVIVRAIRGFGLRAQPGEHSASHRRSAWIGVVLMVGTAVTGWIFYAVAFVA